MSRHVLVINTGSSSLKYSLVEVDTGQALGSGLIERIGEPAGLVHHTGPDGRTDDEREVRNHDDALRLALDAFATHGPSLDDMTTDAIGHRVVHGGDRFSAPSIVDDDLVKAVEELVPLAPLHNPANLEGIEVARRLFPDVPHVAVFDTASHHTLPQHAYTYAVPRDWVEEHHIRRYGFHGTSVAFVAREAARLLDKPFDQCRLIVLHLGNGASATAVDGGRSVETSMGFTPLEGLMMGTRSGDVDPALPAHLHRHLGWSVDDIDRALNRDSGLKGLVGHNDFRELERLRTEGDDAAELAFAVYYHRLRKYDGAYYAVLGEVDAIVFTGGVGQHSAGVRSESLSGLARLGIEVDGSSNLDDSTVPRNIAAEGASVAVLVIPTDEEWEIARQSLEVVDRPGSGSDSD